MKSLKTYISESKEVNLNLTDEELKDDYNLISDFGVDNNEKKQLASKYHLTTKKSKDIQDAILRQLRFNRHNKSVYTHEDVIFFSRLDPPLIYKKFVDVASLEPVEFIEYYKEDLFRQLHEKHLDNRLHMAKSRGAYGISSSDQYLMKKYLVVLQYLDEIGKPVDGRDENLSRQTLHNMLISEMQEFHDALMKDVEKFAKNFWKNLPSYIEESRKLCNLAKDRYYKIDRECCDLHNSRANLTPEGKVKYKGAEELRKIYKKDLEKADRKVLKYINIQKRFGSEAKYVEESLNEAERDYQYNINSIEERVEKQNFNIPETKLSDIKRDPKFFEFRITDGSKSMYCRSVRAAEFSTKVTPHFRFIITNRK